MNDILYGLQFMAKTFDELLKQANTVDEKPPKEMDSVLVFYKGEVHLLAGNDGLGGMILYNAKDGSVYTVHDVDSIIMVKSKPSQSSSTPTQTSGGEE